MIEEKNTQVNNKEGDEIKTIHTYLTDMAETVRDNEVSVVKIAVAEQKKHEREDLYRKAEGTNLTKSLLIIGGIIFLVGACIAVYFVIQNNKETNAPISTINSSNLETIISYDSNSFVDTTKATNNADLVKLLKPEIEKVGNLDSIKSIFLTTSNSGKPESLKLEDFTSLLGLTAPSSLIRSLSEQYMVGTYTPSIIDQNNKPHLFLLFQVKDYNIVYAGMLQWEKTMVSDMYNIFNIDASSNSTIFETPFKDTLVNNKDARIIQNSIGKNILYYIFIDKNNLIITDDQDTIKKVTARLIIKNTKPL